MLLGGSEAAEGFANSAVNTLPSHVVDILTKAKVCWLKNIELAELLRGYKQYGFQVSPQAPVRPPSGSVFLFDRSTLRFFRKDGYRWRKKTDGRTIREAHEKLKVDNKDVLNCYYAQSEEADGLQRRCYWLLEGQSNTVLVHYLAAKQCDRLVIANDLTDHAVPCLTEIQVCQNLLQKSSHTPDTPSPFSTASLFPTHTPHINSPHSRLTQQQGLPTCTRIDSMQAVDSPVPTVSSNDQAVSLSPASIKPNSQHHSPVSLASLVLCGKPIALDSRTASAPISTNQDPRLAFRRDQAYVKRTRSDSAQYVHRNFSNLAAADRSLGAYEAWQSGLIATDVELQPPAKRHQLHDRASSPFHAPQATCAGALPDQAQSQSRQLVHSPQQGMCGQQLSDDRAVPTMPPRPPHSPLGQANFPLRSFLGRPPYQRPASLDPRVVLRQAQQQNQQQQMQQPNSSRELQHYMQSHLDLGGQLQPRDCQLQPLDCQLQSSTELSSRISASQLQWQHSPQIQLQSQAVPWQNSAQGHCQGIFEQQPLTPESCPIPTRQTFSFWDVATDGSPVCTSPEQPTRPKHVMLSGPVLAGRNLTAHLVAQQQAGLVGSSAGSQNLRKYPFASSSWMMQMEQSPCHVRPSVEKLFGYPSSPNTSSPWMQHMTPDLFALEATVPHVTPYSSPGLECAAADDVQY